MIIFHWELNVNNEGSYIVKLIKLFYLGILFTTVSFTQDLCPPGFLDALFFDEKVELDWVQTSSYGDVLFEECFAVCSTATEAFEIVNVDSCGACSGGWFRYLDGTAADCGSGMFPCEDGEDDDYSAYAGYSGTDSTTETYAPVDSRLITGPIDLSDYTAAYIEFIEAYNYPEDATDSNMVEVSLDSGATWEVAYVSNPWDVGEAYWFNTVDISYFAGNVVWVAFRYYDSIGYGESWFVDDIRVWGGNEGDGDICGTFQNYNVYMDGSLIGTSDIEAYTVEDLENGVEYCFEITTVYEEGESDASYEACAIPMGPFQVNPLAVNFDALTMGEYQEAELTIENFDTLDHDFDITSVELSNIDLALDVLVDVMEINFSTFSDPSASGFDPGIWGVDDSASASSTYMVYPVPDDGGQFAYVNDDAIGEGALYTDAWLISDEVFVSGYYPAFLLVDIYFPNPAGPCGPDQAAYADEFKIHVSVDNGETWGPVDSTMSTGWPHWQSHMYNLTQYIGDATSFKVAFQYYDCGGEWGYGVGIDNIKVKEGDDFTWLTVSPYSGTCGYFGYYNDSLTVTVGVYGTEEGFTIAENLELQSGDLTLTVQIGVGVEVSVDESGLTPFEFALHQNYPNPFNPVTNIQFDLAENSDITVSIFNIMGQKVATLVDGNMDAGIYHIKWNGLSDHGIALSSGMYFYKMKSPTFHSIKKLVLVK